MRPQATCWAQHRSGDQEMLGSDSRLGRS